MHSVTPGFCRTALNDLVWSTRRDSISLSSCKIFYYSHHLPWWRWGVAKLSVLFFTFSFYSVLFLLLTVYRMLFFFSVRVCLSLRWLPWHSCFSVFPSSTLIGNMSSVSCGYPVACFVVVFQNQGGIDGWNMKQKWDGREIHTTL
jgi:hypothetical protein